MDKLVKITIKHGFVTEIRKDAGIDLIIEDLDFKDIAIFNASENIIRKEVNHVWDDENLILISGNRLK